MNSRPRYLTIQVWRVYLKPIADIIHLVYSLPVTGALSLWFVIITLQDNLVGCHVFTDLLHICHLFYDALLT